MTAHPPHTAWRELAVLLALAAIGTAWFWLTDLDLRVAHHFYRPEIPGDGWPVARLPLWRFFYEYAGAMTALLALSGLGLLVAGSVKERWRRWRVHGLFAVLLVLLGPGLVVNAIFKDHWGRPRPEHVQTLGGQERYLPPFAIGEPGKYKSFPCGHCSVGFSFAALWLVLRRHHRRFAWAALLGGIALGSLMGVGRMAAGDHWLSDTLWAALFPWLVGWGLYYGLLRMHREPGLGQHHASPARRRWETLGYGAVAVVIVLGAALATPLHEDMAYRAAAPAGFTLIADRAEVTVRMDDSASAAVTLDVYARGFGLPGSKAKTEAVEENGAVTYRLRHEGIFTDIGTRIVITIRPDDPRRVDVRLDRGDIRVEAPQGMPPHSAMNLVTSEGRVSR